MYKDENNSGVQIKLIHKCISYCVPKKSRFFFYKITLFDSGGGGGGGFGGEGSLYLACNDRSALFTSEKPKKFSCTVLLKCLFVDNIFNRVGTKLYRQVVGILKGTNCAPVVADLFLFCYERDFMMFHSDDK